MRDYPERVTDILAYAPDGYVPTQRLLVVQAGSTFRLPDGRETALVQKWESSYAGDAHVWVYVPQVTLLGL